MVHSAEYGLLRDIAVAIAREVGALLVDERPVDLGVATKSTPTDVVTVMDKKAEALVVQRLAETRPRDSILAEEGASKHGTTGVRWIVDPLDGTVNYMHGLPNFAVSIAAAMRDTVVAGAVFDATNRRVHEAVLGGGARSDGAHLRCSPATELGTSLVGTGFSYSANSRARQGKILAELLPKIADIRRNGSAALELCSVAAGTIDCFFERELHPWDRAAGMLIAAEAGARVLLLPDGDDEITVAAAPGIMDALVREITSLQ